MNMFFKHTPIQDIQSGMIPLIYSTTTTKQLSTIVKLQSQGKLIDKLKSYYECYQAENKDSNKDNGLQAELYLCEGYGVRITSNFLARVRLHNSDTGKIIKFF